MIFKDLVVLGHVGVKKHPGQIINRYVMTALICKAYATAKSPMNIRHSFEKTGIYPFDSKRPITSNTFKPAEAIYCCNQLIKFRR